MSGNKLYSRLQKTGNISDGTFPICPSCHEPLNQVVIYYEDEGYISGYQAWNVLEDREVTPYMYRDHNVRGHLNHHYKCDRCGLFIYRGREDNIFELLDQLISVIQNRY